MSLLADLLRKPKVPAASEPREIPPTLARAQNESSATKGAMKRYMAVGVFALALVFLGLMANMLLGRVNKRARKAPAPPPAVAKLPLPPRREAAPAVPSAPQPKTEKAEKAVAKAAPAQQPSQTAQRAAAVRKPSDKAAARLKAPAPVAVVTPARSPKNGSLEQPQAKVSASRKMDAAAQGSILYAARSAEAAGDWKTAMTGYRSVLEAEPDNYRIANNVSVAANRLGLYDQGLVMAKRALEVKPDYVPAMINAAIASSSRGDQAEARRMFSAATALEPGNKVLAVNYGIFLERSGRLDEAMKVYRSPLLANDPAALQGVGRIQEHKGDRSEAIATYKQILCMPEAKGTLKKEIRDRLVKLEE